MGEARKKWGILKINEPTSNDPSSITTSDVPTASSSTDTSATAINIDDYIGMWHIDGQNYDSNYVAAYETELGIEKLSNNKFSFGLFVSISMKYLAKQHLTETWLILHAKMGNI